MDATTSCRLLRGTGATLIHTHSTMGYHDKYPLMDTVFPADTLWILFQSKAHVFGRPLLWAVCFFFGPIISDVISMPQIMWQLVWISSYFIFSLAFVMLQYLQRLAPLQRVNCSTRYLVLPG